MVDAARQMLDELMGRNRNLHPSEAPRKISWDDPDFCQYYVVKFCPHDLFINTRADLGPCTQIHDDEAKRLYEEARPSPRKRSYEDEFLRFCNNMLNDVDRKIQKGKQRLQLMHRDQPTPIIPLSKYQEQLNNINARIKKLLSEAEEAGTRGDVDQAKDLMALCEQLKDEKEALVAQHEQQQQQQQQHLQTNGALKDAITTSPSESNADKSDGEKSPKSEEGGSASGSDKKLLPWMQDLGTLPEKQMEVCEICGAFLIVGDAQQRIEDHLMGKQHLGYSRLRKAVEEIHERRQKDREEEERKRRDEREQRSMHRNSYSHHNERRRDHHDHRDRDRERERERERDYRGHSREHSSRHSADRHRHHHKSSHRRRSHSRSSHRRNSRDRHSHSRSRSRSRY